MLAVLATTLVVCSTAAAHPSVVRVETKNMGSIASGAFVTRVAVDTPGDVVISAPDPSDPLLLKTASCAATSPAAALVQALGAGQVGFTYDAASSAWKVTSVKGLAAVPAAWTWRLYVDQAPMTADEACTSNVPIGSEVLLYQACAPGKTAGCYWDTPLYARVRDGGPYDIAEQTVPGRGAPVVVRTIANLGPTGATVTTDEGRTSVSQPTGVLPGQIGTAFTEYGPHKIIVTKGDGSRAPARVNLCASEGNDGFCGSVKYQAPPEINYEPSPCATNGHDGFCGTADTTGPVSHVTNIKHKQKFKKKKGPGQVKGTIDLDPNRVGDVKLRLTRVTTSRVLIKTKIKTKKKRYKTVKRCTTWDSRTLRLETAKCGVRYGMWFEADLTDLRDAFSYSFAMTLPAGVYKLEVVATDENKFKDLPVTGRNVLTFTVL
ncbi:MAG TPA: hypothetical protein VK501_16185 [Baekduia sp.]|nr:hypothetical protein [Baekduia sp.]